MAVAQGTFTVTSTPVAGAPAGLGRFELDKTFGGGLSGTSQRVMLSAGGEADLTITVVPGSGTGGLYGIDGAITLEVTDGVHHDVLEHTLP